MSELYNEVKDLKDTREFAFGEIWLLRDEFIRLLPSDRVLGKRKIYPSRSVLVVQNCLENNDDESLLIRIAPLSTTIRFEQKFDIRLHPGIDEVKDECMAQIQLTQPILKKDMFKKVGEISVEKKEEVAAAKLELLGIDLNQ
jgi:mRNA interferase MazF